MARRAASARASLGRPAGRPTASASKLPAAQPQHAAVSNDSPLRRAARKAPQKALPHPVGSTTTVPGMFF